MNKCSLNSYVKMSLQMSGVEHNIFHSYIEITLQSPKLYINLYFSKTTKTTTTNNNNNKQQQQQQQQQQSFIPFFNNLQTSIKFTDFHTLPSSPLTFICDKIMNKHIYNYRMLMRFFLTFIGMCACAQAISRCILV